MKKCLIIRYGAFGDNIIITPVLRQLKKDGYEIVFNGSERSQHILKGNPNIDKFIPYKSDSVPNEQLEKHWKKIIKKEKPDRVINFSESIEVAIALHPASPRYNWPRYKRLQYGKINYYEYSAQHAGYESLDDYLPEMFLTETEEKTAQERLDNGCFNIVWGLSGSGKNKAWPWVDIIVNNILSLVPKAHVTFVGDMPCQILEHGWDGNPRVTCRSGKISMRESIALTKYADLVVCPDTGLLHGAGCFNTPKIGLLGHTTKLNITKHFKNDYSIEADPELSECAPCGRLIYDAQTQCPTDSESGAVFCMQYGIPPEKVEKRIMQVYEEREAKTRRVCESVPNLQEAIS